MAIDLTGNPLIFDAVTASAFPTGAFFDVHMIRWTSGSTADTAIVKDIAGVTKWSAVAGAANTDKSEVFNPPLEFNGIQVPTIGAGTVYIYCKRKR